MKTKILAFVAVIMLASCMKKESVKPTEKKKIYYRIKQVDKDGKVIYSKVIVAC